VRPSGYLGHLQHVGQERLRRLRTVAVTAEAQPTERQSEAVVTYCVLELASFWTSFSRSLFLSSAFQARDGAGALVSLSVPKPTSVADALTHAIRRRKWAVFNRKGGPPWTWADEPGWIYTDVLLDALDEIGASNRPQVVAGLGIPTNVFEHLPLFRNFFAHKNEDVRRPIPSAVEVYAISPDVLPWRALLTAASDATGTRPQVLLLDWVDDVSNTVGLMI
jgi:hypothetical protein